MSKKDDDRKAAKHQAVIARIREMGDGLDLLIGMLDERTTDTLILAFGLGRVELND